MKLVIIEGTDRTGKDTLIESLIEQYPHSEVVHWGYPIGDTNDEKTEWQKASFLDYMSRWKIAQDSLIDGLVIWNRSHIGEYVYGTMYRHSFPDTWIPELEKEFLKGNNVILILLQGDPEFIIAQDDGQSYSTQLKDKKIEIQKFEEAFNNSNILNKIKIKINEGDSYVKQTDISAIVCCAINL